MYTYWVYILTNRTNRVLYVGVTGNLHERLSAHKSLSVPGFTSRYRATKLVYVEEAGDPASAIAREKQVKRWRREKKVALIESLNPGWEELEL